MFLIDCPYCGIRDQSEFTHHGEAHIARPVEPDAVSDKEWGEYQFFKTNPKGLHAERWVHSFGCRRWSNAIRHTQTDEFHATYRVGDQKPEVGVGEEK